MLVFLPAICGAANPGHSRLSGGSWPGLQIPRSWRKIIKEDVKV
jgi:hypothetical protein